MDADSLSSESRRYLERLVRLGRRNGLHLPQETQEVMLLLLLLLLSNDHMAC